jgi:hypothetical protein
VSSTYYGGYYHRQLNIGGNSATIGSSGVVKPNPAYYTYANFGGYAGVFSDVNGASLTNNGKVYGIGTYAGVEFLASSTVVNNYKIYGGGNYNGGAGVDFVGGVVSLTNTALGTIQGGSGTGYGITVDQNASGVVNNYGQILGGVGAGGGVLGNNTYLHNESYGVIEGGAGYAAGGRGGIGVYLNGNYKNISRNALHGYIRGGDGGHGTIGIGGAGVGVQNYAEFNK